MNAKKKFIPPNKIVLTEYQKQYIKDNFFKMTNEAIAAELGLSKTYTRMYAYSLGLKRSDVCRWSKEQNEFFLENYSTIGNKELVKLLNEKFPGQKVITKKSISKKFLTLGIRRNYQEHCLITERNRLMGCWGYPINRKKREPKKQLFVVVNSKTRVFLKPGQTVESVMNKYSHLNHLIK